MWAQSLGWEDAWRRKQQPIPVFLLGKFHGQTSLVGYSPLGHRESDMLGAEFGHRCHEAGTCNVGTRENSRIAIPFLSGRKQSCWLRVKL